MKEQMVIDPVSTIATAVVFVLCLSVFAFIVYRAIKMPKKKADQLAEMPLKENEDSTSTRENES
jgi:cytochrome c-type biogenesis protein CcmH/NrfG